MKALVRVLPWLLLGPLTAPLFLCGCRALRRGEKLLGGLYFTGSVVVWIDLPLVAHHLTDAVARLPH